MTKKKNNLWFFEVIIFTLNNLYIMFMSTSTDIYVTI